MPVTVRDRWVGLCGLAAAIAGIGLWYGLYGPDGAGTDGFRTPERLFITIAVVGVATLGLAALGGIVASGLSPLALIAASILVPSAVLLEMWIGPWVIPGSILGVVAAIGWNATLAYEADAAADASQAGRR
jgi:hypothetical protein